MLNSLGDFLLSSLFILISNGDTIYVPQKVIISSFLIMTVTNANNVCFGLISLYNSHLSKTDLIQIHFHIQYGNNE